MKIFSAALCARRVSAVIFFLILSIPSFSQHNLAKAKRIIFLGNSITWQGNYVTDIEAYLRVQYPDREWEFINLGLSSETVSGLSEEGHAGGSFPRPDLHERLLRVLEQTKPDLVFACYGMNDGIYLPFDNGRFAKFKEGINWLHSEVQKSGAKIIHLTPPDYDELRGKAKGYSAVLDRYTDWLLSMRSSAKWQVIDIHYPMKKYLQAHRKLDADFRLDGFALANDGVHPGETGHWIMAREILAYLGFKEVLQSTGITGSLKKINDPAALLKLLSERQHITRDAWLTATKHQRPGLPIGLPLPEAQKKANEMLPAIMDLIKNTAGAMKDSSIKITRSKWKGFKRSDFILAGRACLVVEPHKAVNGNPWIWRTEFFGHEPQGDSSLASKGFHVVYMDVQNMYGAPASLDLMDVFYTFLTGKKKLNKKTVLEGFSRGGLFAFNWAARHPDRVGCIYVDAPVCDFKSWPGGKGKSPGSKNDWEMLKKVYGFASEEQAISYTLNPIDNLQPLAIAKIPILAVCGETDDLVPMAENINIVEERYKKMGGNIKLITKPNNGHHPHSLKDPKPIVDFVVRAMSL